MLLMKACTHPQEMGMHDKRYDRAGMVHALCSEARTYKRTHTHTVSHIPTPTHPPPHPHTHTQAHTYTHAYRCPHDTVTTQLRAHTRIHTHAHTHTHTRARTHIHTPAPITSCASAVVLVRPKKKSCMSVVHIQQYYSAAT